MKQRLMIILAILIIILCSILLVNAEDVTLSIAGSESAYVGDVLKVTIKINGSEINKVKGTITYNKEQLELKTVTPLISEPWVYTPDGVDTSNGDFNFELSDESSENKLNGEIELLSVEFTVLEVPENTEISVSMKDISVTVNSEEEMLDFDEIVFHTTVIKKLSENDFLKELNVTNATISPSFNKEIINYTASVPFSVNKLQFTALTEDLNATMKVENPELIANGKTSVTITVTSEANTKRVYTILVTRAPDPNSTKSGNNKLSTINVGQTLTPSFDPDVTEYLMEVPNDKTSISISASAQDSKSTYVIEGGNNLVVGDNVVKITCTAENGSKRVYTITVKRLPIEGTPTAYPTAEPTPVVTADTTQTPEQTTSATDEPKVIIVSDPRGMSYIFVIILIIVFFGIGFIFGMSINVRRKEAYEYPNKAIIETDFGQKVTEKKNKDMLFIVEDNLRDDDK